MAADTESQVPIFLDRIRGLFRSSSEEEYRDEDSNQGIAIAVCVLLSVVLWLSLTLQEQRMVSVEFPVEVAHVPADRALAERPPSSVTVELQGIGLDLLGLVFGPPTIEVEADQGRVDVRDAVSLPRTSNARVESVTPRVFELVTEPRVERRVPVRPRFNIRPAPAYELIDRPTLDPDSVTLAGAESVVGEIRAWATDSLVLNDVKDTIRTRVSLRDSLPGLVDRATEKVAVVVRAGKFAEETREAKVQVTGVPAGQNLVTLQPSTIRIRYRVLFDQLFASRRSSEFFATVSYDQIRSDTTGYVEPQIHVPNDLVIRDPEPIPQRLRYYTFLTGD